MSIVHEAFNEFLEEKHLFERLKNKVSCMKLKQKLENDTFVLATNNLKLDAKLTTKQKDIIYYKKVLILLNKEKGSISSLTKDPICAKKLLDYVNKNIVFVKQQIKN